MNKNTILTIALVIVAILAIYFAYQANENKKIENQGVMQRLGNEIDETSEEIGHEVDEAQDKMENKVNDMKNHDNR